MCTFLNANLKQSISKCYFLQAWGHLTTIFLLRNANYVIENVLLLNVLITAAHNNGAVFKSLTTTTTTTSAPKSGSSTRPTSRGKRKIIVNLMDVYHCPKPGEHTDWALKGSVIIISFQGPTNLYSYGLTISWAYNLIFPGAYPIDGDCSRFLLCRQGRQGESENVEENNWLKTCFQQARQADEAGQALRQEAGADQGEGLQVP